MLIYILRFIYIGITSFLSIPYLLIAVLISIAISWIPKKIKHQPRLVWGSTPIINNVYWSRAMHMAGYQTETYTKSYFSTINKREDWDVLIEEKYKGVPISLKYYLAFIEALIKYDIFFISFNGFFLGRTPLWRFEAILFRLAGKKTVVLPYGGDSYVYRRIRSTSTVHGLLMSYPRASHLQGKVARRVDYWCEYGDIVCPGIMGFDGFGRWDILMPSSLYIDTNQWNPSSRKSSADGHNDTVFIVHAPNHRGIKGTEFVVAAVDRLISEGLKVELLLLEKLQNEAVRQIFETKADILIEQLIITGHGLNGIEGMASSLPVISNLEDETYTLPLRRWSYLSECPIVSGTPETLVDVLRKLVTRPALRQQLGKAGREYVEKYHNLDSAQFLFKEIIDYLYDRRDSLINLFHPLLGEYQKDKPKVEHPLINNRIVD